MNQRVAAQTSHFINRTGSLINSAWREDETSIKKSNLEEDREYVRASSLPWDFQEEYIDEVLSKKGRNDLNDLYKNNQKFKDQIINFVGDKAELDREKILDKRFKCKTLNKLSMETLAKFTFSKD